MSTLDMSIYRLCPRQWTGLTSLTPLTPSLPLVQATERHFFSHRCQASSDREIHPSSSSSQILSHLSPSYQTLTGHEALLVRAFLASSYMFRKKCMSKDFCPCTSDLLMCYLCILCTETIWWSDPWRTGLVLIFMSSFVGWTAQRIYRKINWKHIFFSGIVVESICCFFQPSSFFHIRTAFED